MNHTISLGQRIRQTRKEMGMTQHELATGIVTSSMICQIENGKAFPSYQVLSAISDRLSKPIEYFVSDTDAAKRQRSSFTLARALMAAGSYEKAYTLLTTIQEASQNEQEEFLLTLSECCQQLGKYDEAVAPLEDMLETAKQSNNVTQMVSLLIRLGEIAEHGGQFQLALYHWQKAYEQIDQAEIEPARRSQLFTHMGNTYYKLGYTDDAIFYLQRAYNERDSFRSLEELGQMYLSLSLSFREGHDLEQAKQYSERAYTLFKSMTNVKLATDVKRSMAVLQAEQGELDEALTELQACQEHYSLQYDSFNVGLTQLEIACVLQKQNKLQEAIPMMKNALTMLSGDELEMARAHRLLADMYRACKEMPDAIHHVNQALGLYHKHGHSLAMVEAMNLSAVLYEEWEQYRTERFGGLITA